MHQGDHNRPLEIRFWSGAEALAWCRANEHRWRELQRRCDDENPFLAPAFVSAWYAHYHARWTPVLATGDYADGRLAALMPLAHGAEDQILTAAGANQSEYQGWLCEPEWDAAFLAGLARRMDADYPGHALALQHIRAHEQVTALQGSPFGPRLDISVQHKPVFEIDLDAVAASEKKSGNRSKLKRLEAGGAIEAVRARDSEQLNKVIDAIADDYDFRQGATNAATPFASDTQKRRFHLEWMEAAPQEFYVLALRQQGRIIAGLIGTVVGTEVAVGIHSHAPELANCSPGKFLLHQAARDLGGTQVRRIDLTPGGETWKDRMASTSETVWSVRIHPNARARRRKQARATVRSSARRLGLREPAIAAARLASRLRSGTWRAALRRHLPTGRRELRVYGCALAGRSAPPENAGIRVNSTRDLVRLAQALEDRGLYDRRLFLADSAQRLKQGHWVYTRCENEVPVHHLWVAPLQSETFFSEIGSGFCYPQPGPVCYDAFTLPQARERDHATATLARALHELARRDGAEMAYVPVLAGNESLEGPVVNHGGTVVAALIRTRVLAWSSIRTVHGPEQSTAEPDTTLGTRTSGIASAR